MHQITTNSVNKGYRQAIDLLLKEGEETSPRGMKTKELHPFCWTITDPRRRSMEIVGRWKNLGFQLAECLWIANGKNDLETLNHYVPGYEKYSDDRQVLSGAYGSRLRNWRGIDQFQSAYEKLLQDKDSRQAVMIIFDPEKDYLPTRDVPCTNWYHLTIRQGKLDWTTVMRSNDILWGTPYNMYNFMTLQEIFAGWLGVEVGKYCHIVDCVHIYTDKLDIVKRMVYQENNSIDIYDYFPPQDARLPKSASEKVLKDMQQLQDCLLSHPLRKTDLDNSVEIASKFKGYWRSFAFSLIAYEEIRQGHAEYAVKHLPEINNEFLPSLCQRMCRTFFRNGIDPEKMKVWPLIKAFPEPVIKFILENPVEEEAALEEICV